MITKVGQKTIVTVDIVSYTYSISSLITSWCVCVCVCVRVCVYVCVCVRGKPILLFLNQACVNRTRAWFLIIASVRECLYGCACMCVSAPKALNN